MKYMLFAHDHRFHEYDGRLYSKGGLSNEVLSRYVKYFGKVIVLARIKKETKLNGKFSLISEKNVCIMNYKSMTNKEIEETVKNSNLTIVRLPSFIGNKVCKYSRKNKKSYSVELVGCAWDSFWNYSLIGKIVAPIMLIITRYYVKYSENVLYVTNHFLQKRYPTNGKCVSCSDATVSDMSKTILQKRISKIKNANDVISLATIGAIDVKYKGQEYVIKALGKLKKSRVTNFKYSIIGSGNPNRLQKIAKKNNVSELVEFSGSIPHEKIYEKLDDIDMYIHPSLTEGLCRSIVEAMSRACPCIVSNSGGNPELIDKKWVFRKKNTEELKNLILEMCSCKDNMINAATDNFNNAKKFNTNNLDKSRDSFYLNINK